MLVLEFIKEKKASLKHGISLEANLLKVVYFSLAKQHNRWVNDLSINDVTVIFDLKPSSKVVDDNCNWVQ